MVAVVRNAALFTAAVFFFGGKYLFQKALKVLKNIVHPALFVYFLPSGLKNFLWGIFWRAKHTNGSLKIRKGRTQLNTRGKSLDSDDAAQSHREEK